MAKPTMRGPMQSTLVHAQSFLNMFLGSQTQRDGQLARAEVL